MSTLRVAVYCRISEDAEGDALGVERQREDCLAYAADHGWTVADVIVENDTSASTRSKKMRPKYAAMIRATKAGQYDVLLAYSTSRLTRRPREFNELIELYEEHGVQIVSLSDRIDLTTSSGRFVARVMADKDAEAAERTGELVARKQAANRVQGHLNTKRAFGWAHAFDSHTGKRVADVLHPEEGPALQKALQMLREGESLNAVTRYWNSLGLTTLSGKAWTPARTREVVVRWRNCGVLIHRGQPVEGIEGQWEPACTRDEFQAVLNALSGRTTGRVGPGRAPTAFLSHAASCGRCGRPMLGGKQRGGRKDPDGWVRVYRCAGSTDQTGAKCWTTIRRDYLEPLVLRAVREALWFGNVASLTPTVEEREQVAALNAERAEIVGEEEQIGRLLGQRKMSLVAATAALEGLSERRETIDVEVGTITSRYALNALFERSGRRLSFAQAGKIATEFSGLEVTQQREIVRGLFNVVIQPGRDPLRRVQIAKKDGTPVALEWVQQEEEPYQV